MTVRVLEECIVGTYKDEVVAIFTDGPQADDWLADRRDACPFETFDEVIIEAKDYQLTRPVRVTLEIPEDASRGSFSFWPRE